VPASAMDGYAYAHDRIDPSQPLRVVGTAAAGHPYTGALEPQTCLRMLTGASVPDSADTVVIQENVVRQNDQVQIRSLPERGANIRAVGQEVVAGQQLLPAGTRLNAFHLGLLASVGLTELTVRRCIRVQLVSTGDELVPAGSKLEPGQIFDSNRALLTALLSREDVTIERSVHLRDDADATAQALNAAGHSDLLITSGGVSVGDSDYIGRALAERGSLNFWRLNLKPGKPVAFGRIGDCWMLGLPGNPVSTAITALLLVLPALRRLSGEPAQPLLRVAATLTHPIRHNPGRTEFQRGVLEQRSSDSGARELIVTPTGDQSSNRLSTFSAANCLIEIDKSAGDLDAGTRVHTLPLGGLLG
ncbi:MAG: gephyrin-like molybdotransferase Glp, partial [Pseudomonadota bacterium]